MDEIVTIDLSQFGEREIEEAKVLLSWIKEIDSYGKVELCFNTHSGNVFLSDEDYRVWMMNGNIIEEWYSCPYCGHEGFLDYPVSVRQNGRTIGLVWDVEEIKEVW